MQQPRSKMITHRHHGSRAGLTSLLGLMLLAGCGAPTAQTPTSTATYATTVPVAPGDTEADVAQRYHGSVAVWHPEAGFAVLGLQQPLQDAQIGGLSVEVLGTHHARRVRSETNRRRFDRTTSAWAGQPGRMNAEGSAYIWSGGSAHIWSGGSAHIWSGGNGSSGIPENSSAMTQIGVPGAWQRAPLLGEGVKVAVIDTGIDLNHPMFEGALAPAEDRYDFVDEDSVPQEEGDFSRPGYGHGTNVASIVLQVAPHAQIMPLRALDPDGGGDQTSVARAIDFAVRHGAKVINLSLGSVDDTQIIQAMIDYATSMGVNVTASSGNTGDTRVTYPARSAADTGPAGALTFSVGSVDSTDHKSSFSTYGESIELAAPGEHVWGPVPGNLFSYWSGTSMAAPMAAGALALARAEVPNTPVATLSRALTDTATDVKALNDATPVGRRLNVDAFLQALTTP